MPRTLSIMGVRGIPAQHGGFETFTERLAPYLTERGWTVTVYCQETDRLPVRESRWGTLRRVHIGVGPDTPLSTMRFDWLCIAHAVRDKPSLVLTLGYNTAAFGLRLRAAGIPNVLNMDGIEWSRQKWGRVARFWLYLNEWAGSIVANHLVADHPQIAEHLCSRVASRKITTIPYGATVTGEVGAEALAPLGLEPHGFVTIIARAEPENSILEMVTAFSSRPRQVKMVVLGRFERSVAYHAAVLDAASSDVVFPGAIYDPEVVQSLRRHCALYLHGHQVGGTNPSLLEAMGAGNAVLAHDNRFNRWVAADGAEYFSDLADCTAAIDRLLADAPRRARMGAANLIHARRTFHWSDVLRAYDSLLTEVHTWAHGHPSWPRGADAVGVDVQAER